MSRTDLPCRISKPVVDAAQAGLLVCARRTAMARGAGSGLPVRRFGRCYRKPIRSSPRKPHAHRSPSDRQARASTAPGSSTGARGRHGVPAPTRVSSSFSSLASIARHGTAVSRLCGEQHECRRPAAPPRASQTTRSTSLRLRRRRAAAACLIAGLEMVKSTTRQPSGHFGQLVPNRSTIWPSDWPF